MSQVQHLWYCVPMSRKKSNPVNNLLPDRLRKIADALYTSTQDHGEAGLQGHLHDVAHLVEVIAVEADAEITQLKRSLGGLNGRLAQLSSKLKAAEENQQGLLEDLDVLTTALDEEQARNRQLEDRLAVAELQLLKVKK